MLVNEFSFLGVVEDGLEQRGALLVRHALHADRHQAVDVDRLAAGILMRAEDRMHAFAERLGALVVAALDRAIVVMVYGATAFELVADCGIERVIGSIAAGEQGIAAG